MSNPPRGLGRGVNAIFGDLPSVEELQRKPINYNNTPLAANSPASGAGVLRVPLSQIEPNPYQPRLSFNQEELEGLAASIKSLGLISPITLRKLSPVRYQIISGERRYRACQLAGMDQVPAYIREADDQGMLEMAIVENVQRENLDPIEIALSYQRLIDECRLTQEQMAARLGKSRSSITNQIRLLKLPVKVQHDLKLGQISVGHAKVLLSLDDADVQSRLCDWCIKNDVNVRQLEQKVKALAEASAKKEGEESHPEQIAANEDIPDLHKEFCKELSRYFRGRISLKRSGQGKGSITISFSSDSEVSRFLDVLKNS